MPPKEAELLKTRITFVGEDYWTAHLAAGLNSRYPDTVSCTAIRLRANSIAVLQTAWHLMRDAVIVRVGFPPPALPSYDEDEFACRQGSRERIKRVLFRSALGRGLRLIVLFLRFDTTGRNKFAIDRMFRLARGLRRNRRDFMYWIGTDVLDMAHRAAAGTVAPAVLAETRRSRNIAGAEHLAEELRSAGVDATTVPFPGATLTVPASAPPMPPVMTVASYIPAERRDFYGLPALLGSARALPDVSFRFFGSTAERGADLPGNVEFLGYVNDVAPLYRGSSVVVRLVEHDAVGATVMEGLLYGRQVVYSYPLPHTLYVPFGDAGELTAALSRLRKQHLEGGIPVNEAGRAWGLQEFDVDRRFKRLAEALLA